MLWNFVNKGHHGESLGDVRGFIDIFNAFRFFNLESCIVGQPLPTDLQETVGIYSKFKYELKLLKAKHNKIMLSTANW